MQTLGTALHDIASFQEAVCQRRVENGAENLQEALVSIGAAIGSVISNSGSVRCLCIAHAHFPFSFPVTSLSCNYLC